MQQGQGELNSQKRATVPARAHGTWITVRDMESLEIETSLEIDHSGTAHGSMDACALNVFEHPGECKQLKHDGKYQCQAIPSLSLRKDLCFEARMHGTRSGWS